MGADKADLLAEIRGRAQQKLAHNARGLTKLLQGLPAMSLEERAKRPWDVVARAQMAGKIFNEEKDRSIRDAAAAGLPHAANNRFDAQRHARASQRLTTVIGPALTEVAGYGVEAAGLVRNLAENAREFADPEHRASSFAAGLSEAAMDLRNNAEGRRAAMEHRSIRPEALQAAPARAAEYEFLYDKPVPGRTGLPPR